MVQRQPWPRLAMLMKRFSGFLRAPGIQRCGAAPGRSPNSRHSIVVPAELRETLQHLDTIELVSRCLDRNEEVATNPVTAAWMAMRFLAERIRYLEQELMVLGRQLDLITHAIAPDLRAAQAIGPDNAAAMLIAAGDNPQRLRSEAAFAALCGASPIPASSGTRQRHRLNRGGNRQANCALFRIALNRLRWDPGTKGMPTGERQRGRASERSCAASKV